MGRAFLGVTSSLDTTIASFKNKQSVILADKTPNWQSKKPPVIIRGK